MYDREKFFLLDPLRNEGLYQLLKETKAVIAGGALRAVFTNTAIQDYDCYFPNAGSISKIQKDLQGMDGVKLLMETDTAATYSKGKIVLQVIKKFINENPEDIIGEFDFTVCMAAYDVANDEFCLGKHFLIHNAQKRLVFNPKTMYPLTSLIRSQKYINKYGYTLSSVEMVKMGLAVNNLKLDTLESLKDALLGIDTMFLKDLTDKLGSEEFRTAKYDFDEFMDLLDQYVEDFYDRMLD